MTMQITRYSENSTDQIFTTSTLLLDHFAASLWTLKVIDKTHKIQYNDHALPSQVWHMTTKNRKFDNFYYDCNNTSKSPRLK
jgi:hypothetical protein